jgi:DNA-binding transcriptional MocR family regulator
LAGRYKTRVEELKFLNTLTTSSIPQMAIAEYLKHDAFEHHLRRIRKAYAQQASIMASVVKRFFPAATKISHPMGGYVLWVELPETVDSMQLYHRALECKITIGPGRMFAVGDAYKHCIRLNYSYPWTNEIDQAIRKLGNLLTEFV